jgi:hypothetical protein
MRAVTLSPGANPTLSADTDSSWFYVPLRADGQLALPRVVREKQRSIALGSGCDIVDRDEARFDVRPAS